MCGYINLFQKHKHAKNVTLKPEIALCVCYLIIYCQYFKKSEYWCVEFITRKFPVAVQSSDAIYLVGLHANLISGKENQGNVGTMVQLMSVMKNVESLPIQAFYQIKRKLENRETVCLHRNKANNKAACLQKFPSV